MMKCINIRLNDIIRCLNTGFEGFNDTAVNYYCREDSKGPQRMTSKWFQLGCYRNHNENADV